MTHTRYAFINAGRYADIVRELRDAFAQAPALSNPSAALPIGNRRAAPVVQSHDGFAADRERSSDRLH